MSTAFLKKLGFLTAILIGLLAVYLYRQVPHLKAPFAKAADQTATIVLEQSARKINLHKEGGQWKVSAGASTMYPAENDQADTLLSSLKDVQVEDEISDRPDRDADFDLTKESGIHVSLLDSQGTPHAEGWFGKQSSDFSHIYFRYPDRPNVYLARGMIRGDLGKFELNSWREHDLVTIPETKFQEIVIEGNGFKTDLVRTSTDVWTINGQPAGPSPVNMLIGILAHLRADDFVDPVAYPKLKDDGLSFAKVRIKSSETSVELRVGPEDITSKRYPASTGPVAGLVWISERSVTSILKKPADFTIKK